MVAMNEIEQSGRRIGLEFGVEKVILFGSYAHGVPLPDLDVDLPEIAWGEGMVIEVS